MSDVKVYGADWCDDTKAVRANLDSLGVQYEYIDVDRDAKAKEWVKAQNGGTQKTPTVAVGNKVLSVPDERQLEESLRGTGLMG